MPQSEPQYDDTAASGADAAAVQSMQGSFIATVDENAGVSSSVLISDVKIEEYMHNKNILIKQKDKG